MSSKYDNDKDGIVDALFIVHAGPGAEITGNTNHIWSHMAFIPSKSVNGVRVSRYSMEPEDGKPGVFCHELAHVFGLPDLYDYDLDSAGTGKWDLMAAGSWNNDGYTPAHPVAWCKAKLGWMTPDVISEPQREITLRGSNLFPDAYKLPVDNDSRQYFLIENRKRTGFDPATFWIPAPPPESDPAMVRTCLMAAIGSFHVTDRGGHYTRSMPAVQITWRLSEARLPLRENPCITHAHVPT